MNGLTEGDPEIRTVCEVRAWLHRSYREVATQRSAARKRARRTHGAIFKAQVAWAAGKDDTTLVELVEQLSV